MSRLVLSLGLRLAKVGVKYFIKNKKTSTIVCITIDIITTIIEVI